MDNYLLVHFTDLESEEVSVSMMNTVSLIRLLTVKMPVSRILKDDKADDKINANLYDILYHIEEALGTFYENRNKGEGGLLDPSMILLGVIFDPIPHHSIMTAKFASRLTRHIEEIIDTTRCNYNKIKSISVSTDHGQEIYIRTIKDAITVGLTQPTDMYFVADKSMYAMYGITVYRCYKNSKGLFEDPASVQWIENELINNNYNSYNPTDLTTLCAVKVDYNPLSKDDLALILDCRGHRIGDLLYHSKKMFLIHYTAFPVNYIATSQFKNLIKILIDMAPKVKEVIIHDDSEDHKRWISEMKKDTGYIQYCNTVCVDPPAKQWKQIDEARMDETSALSEAAKLAKASEESKKTAKAITKDNIKSAIKIIKEQLSMLEVYLDEYQKE